MITGGIRFSEGTARRGFGADARELKMLRRTRRISLQSDSLPRPIDVLMWEVAPDDVTPFGSCPAHPSDPSQRIGICVAIPFR